MTQQAVIKSFLTSVLRMILSKDGMYPET